MKKTKGEIIRENRSPIQCFIDWAVDGGYAPPELYEHMEIYIKEKIEDADASMPLWARLIGWCGLVKLLKK